MNNNEESGLAKLAQVLKQSRELNRYQLAQKELNDHDEAKLKLRDLEKRFQMNDTNSLQQLLLKLNSEPLIREYLEARIEVIQLLQQVNTLLSNQIGINIAGSLQPASCCG